MTNYVRVHVRAIHTCNYGLDTSVPMPIEGNFYLIYHTLCGGCATAKENKSTHQLCALQEQ